MIIKRLLSATVLSIGLMVGTCGVAGADNPNFAPHTPAQVHQVKVEYKADVTAAKKTYKETLASNPAKAATAANPKERLKLLNNDAKQDEKRAIASAKAKYDRTLAGGLHNTYGFTTP
jgi:hypothetical protein